jgi:TM2 domain-containing membrane protein YozV
MMAEQQTIVVKTQKSMGIAYALLIFLGQFGLHRFYLNRPVSGVIQLLLGVIGWATSWLLIGYIPLAILWLWLVIDLFLTAGMVRSANASL